MAENKSSDEMFKSVLEAGQTALKSGLLINGGAATALLAVLAEGLKAEKANALTAALPALSYAWLWFVLGLGCCGGATGFRYLSQSRYAHDGHSWGDLWNVVATTAGVSGFVLFFAGAGQVFRALMRSL